MEGDRATPARPSFALVPPTTARSWTRRGRRPPPPVQHWPTKSSGDGAAPLPHRRRHWPSPSSGVLVLFFLAPYPQYVGFDPSPTEPVTDESTDGEDVTAAGGAGKDRRDAGGIFKALAIPGVVIFALCLFFAKLVAYTFLYWLPFYLSQTGGIVGGVLAGFISDQLNARATTAAVFMYLAIPSLFLFNAYGSTSKATNIGLMMISGLFVNGPYADQWPKWMQINSLDELKTKVGHVIVMILLVKMSERSKMVTIATGLDLLSYSVCIFLSSASLYILHILHKGDPEDD